MSPREINGALRRRDLAQRVSDVLAAANSRRIALRPDDDEVVVHDVETLHALPFGHELVFGGPVMDEHHVGIASPPDIQRLAGADGYDLHVDALGLREQRQQIAEQTRLFRRCRRGHDDGAILRKCAC
ncbi:hypothetical protein ACVJDU_003685 [Bradyrhizobium diazoefficiens]